MDAITHDKILALKTKLSIRNGNLLCYKGGNWKHLLIANKYNWNQDTNQSDYFSFDGNNIIVNNLISNLDSKSIRDFFDKFVEDNYHKLVGDFTSHTQLPEWNLIKELSNNWCNVYDNLTADLQIKFCVLVGTHCGTILSTNLIDNELADYVNHIQEHHALICMRHIGIENIVKFDIIQHSRYSNIIKSLVKKTLS